MKSRSTGPTKHRVLFWHRGKQMSVDMPGYGTKELPDGYDDDENAPETPEECFGCPGGSLHGKHCKRDGNCPPEEDE